MYERYFDSNDKSKAIINLDGSLNEKRLKKQKREQSVENNSLIMKNKDDDIEDTFCYKLFEE